MEEILKDYLHVQDLVKNNDQLSNLIENLFEESSSAVVMLEDITKHLPYPTFLVHTWRNVNNNLETHSTHSKVLDNIVINDKYFYGCLYATMMMEDERMPEDSPVLISLITCLRVGMLRGSEEFTKAECLKVLLVGLKRIHTRDLVGWHVSSELMYDCLLAIKIMTMDATLINSFINMLMIYAGKHFNMVNNLSLADNKSPCGLLAFACLANLFVKNCEDKQTIMETMLENIEHIMEDNSGLNAFQVSVKQSNFRVMIRQVGSALTSYTDHILFAMLRVAERHPKSKSLLFIINQLPYALFYQFANVVVKLSTRTYYQQMQMFSFNMLESPYITEEDEQSTSLDRLYQQISESIVWPLQKFEHQPVLETIKLIYAMLQIQNEMVRSIIFRMTQNSPIMKDLMTYINQFCNNDWKQEHKVMNQYYISVYCRLLILNKDTVYNPQFRQFTLLLMQSNPHDLYTCLKDLKALTTSETFQLKEVQVVMVNSLARITKAMTPQSIHFLRLLHEIIFGDVRIGNDCYNLLTLKTPQCDLVLKNMVKSRLITLRDIENLSVLCKHLRGWRLMSDLAIHMDFALSKHIQYFTEHLHEMRERILKDSTVLHITRFFTEILDRKGRSCPKNEKEMLMRFSVFLEGSLINRSVPISALPLALLTIRKYHTFYNSPLARLQAMNAEVEEKTATAFKEILREHGNFNKVAILTRDISYFGEIQMVFGDLPSFKPQEDTKLAVENGIMYLPNIKREFTPLACVMLKCMTKVAIRQDDLLASCVSSLTQLLKFEQPKVKEIALDCLYDIALFRTSSYEMLIPHVYDLMTTRNPLDAVSALNMYEKLFAKEHTIPNDWQTFVIALAIGNEDVVKLIDPPTMELFMEKLNPYFETYFIHIMFYCNDICDNDDHVLLPEYRTKIMPEKLSSEQRHHLYCKLIKYFRPACRTKILNYIYKQLAHKYLRPGELESMLEDILVVTYETLKGVDYPEMSRFHYEKSLAMIKKLEAYTSKKMGNGSNADEIIISIIMKLTKLLYNLEENYPQLTLKLFHVVFAVIDWNYSSIFNAIVDEGMNGKVRKRIIKLLPIYANYSHLFHFCDVLPGIGFQANPIQSNCNRI